MIDLFLSRGARVRRHHRGLASQFDRLLALADDADVLAKRDPQISGWSVGEQLEHLAKVDQKIFRGIEALLDDPTPSDRRPKPLAYVLMLLGRIPRGKAKSPEDLAAQGIDAAEVREILTQQKAAWDALGARLDEVAACRARAPHPHLGHFDAAQWVRFAQMHLMHHVRLVDDILAA